MAREWGAGHPYNKYQSMGMQPAGTQHAVEVAAGERFEFGKNWGLFLTLLNEQRIDAAAQSLTAMVGPVGGKRFLDAGSGSGLFSLAARRMGARVHSFDFDPDSVACTNELRRRYFPGDAEWTVEAGSVLDARFLSTLGTYDVVYSWGVLHHTGQMWRALDLIAERVAGGGSLYIAIYNDQGRMSRRWTGVKRAYNRLPPALRFLLLWPSFLYLYWRPLLKDLLFLRPGHTFRTYDEGGRGMTVWRDLVDWVGGYPFEVAKPEEILDFLRAREFQLERMQTTNDMGCNIFVFRKH